MQLEALIPPLLLPLPGPCANPHPAQGAQDKGWYRALRKPWWTPPPIAFPVVWPLLYAAMGLASYRVAVRLGSWTTSPLDLYAGQLLLNWAWSPLFFGARAIRTAAGVVVGLWGAVALTTRAFAAVDPVGGCGRCVLFVWRVPRVLALTPPVPSNSHPRSRVAHGALPGLADAGGGAQPQHRVDEP
jgi:benzodiazapine receptor